MSPFERVHAIGKAIGAEINRHTKLSLSEREKEIDFPSISEYNRFTKRTYC
jgi:hypothetical protein